MQPTACVLFDAYGTLFDVYDVGVEGERIFPGRGAELATLWRDKQLEYSRLVTMCGDDARYRPFWDITISALHYACLRLALDLTPETEAALLGAYRRLRAFPDVHGTLQALKRRGVITGILSNGDPPMLEASVRSASLTSLLDHVISVDAVRKFKTAPEAYALGPIATGVPAQATLFVSCNGWDALCAGWWGYRTYWVNRNALPFETLGGNPEHTGSDLGGVLASLEST